MSEPVRIAMWSGPRNLSTALMRSFENRDDCCVVDEPFYACYLQTTGIDHPMRDAVLESQPRDWAGVRAQLTAPLPDGCTLQYQKHMTHHMVVPLDADWLQTARHAFLIRDPVDMVASYAIKREQMTATDLGLDKEAEIYDTIHAATGRPPPVIEAGDVLRDPERVLRALCQALDVPFSEKMLSWPAGPRDSDGVWAPHWYHAVERSTGFAPPPTRRIELSAEQQAVADRCQPAYEYLRSRKLPT